MFAVLDIESTGGPFGKEAIMEIAIFRFDGSEITDQLISLVHPHRSPQKFVSKMTGITEKMLLRAPRFHEIARRIVDITEGAVIVGHNVAFDYRMLRQEFGRLGYPFERQTLDTIGLAEELIPGLPSYGLDAVCEALGLFRTRKHRADSDARATLELLKILQGKDRQKRISVVGQSIRAEDYYRDRVQDMIRGLKENRGLFYLHHKKGPLLYLGASDNIRAALSRLLISESKRASKLRHQLGSIRTEAVGNWLIARIKKQEEQEAARPPFNKVVPDRPASAIYEVPGQGGARLVHRPEEQNGLGSPLVRLLHSREASRALRMFQRQSGREEEILNTLRQFPRQTIFQGRGRKNTERCAVIVEYGKLTGYFYFSLHDDIAHMDLLAHKMTPVPPRKQYTEWLKLGVLSGEFMEVREVDKE